MTKIQINDSPAETPTEQVVKKAQKRMEVTDGDGRKIVVRKLMPMDRLNLFKIIGKLQENPGVFNYLLTAYHVVSIDGEDVPKNTVLQLEAIVQRLGEFAEVLFLKIMDLYENDPNALELQEKVKNLLSTQT